MEYRVMLEEGHSCMGGDESSADSCFETYEEAVARSEAVVRQSLAALAAQGFRGESLLAAYEARGAQPFIVPACDPAFDAVAWARKAVLSGAD